MKAFRKGRRFYKHRDTARWLEHSVDVGNESHIEGWNVAIFAVVDAEVDVDMEVTLNRTELINPPGAIK